jgi:hypothetical protein
MLYITDQSTFPLHLMSSFLIVPVPSLGSINANNSFAVDPFVKPRYRVVYSVKLLVLIKYVLYVSNYNYRQICLLRTLVTGEMCKLR